MEFRAGSSYPLGIKFCSDGVNFSLFAPNASSPVLCLFGSFGVETSSYVEVPLFGSTDGCWHVFVSEVNRYRYYAYRVGGVLLTDPYSRYALSPSQWGDRTSARLPLLSVLREGEPFDWQGTKPPKIPLKDLVMYEAHVRGFTIHHSSRTVAPGTFLGMVEKIPYLKRLGVNAIELMPVFEFDETLFRRRNPRTTVHLLNYWGYSPIHFFLPMGRYAVRMEDAVIEFKTMVREFHRENIEVILDVVYNHTGEGDDYLVSFRGLDKSSYYMLNPKGGDKNYTGCGNTFLCNGKAGRTVIIESMKYWVCEMGVDGFRFDLASILTRGFDGAPLQDPPILSEIAQTPELQGIKLIAEAWDAAGLYQLGRFPLWGPWSSWNGRYRDHVRKFIKGTDGMAGAFAAALAGSEPTFGAAKTPLAGVNFITSHDGFSLNDLVSYQDKHNENNGEENRDGCTANYSWNCGEEGPSSRPEVNALRERQMRNFWLALFLSQGIPLFLMGDEVGHSRKGNNNPYAQDNELNWFDWDEVEKKDEKVSFLSSLIAFRRRHDVLRRETFLTNQDIIWHGHHPFCPDWGEQSRFVACTVVDQNPLYIAFNAHYLPAHVILPPSDRGCWHLVVNSDYAWGDHHLDDPERGPKLGEEITLAPYSSLLAKLF